MDAQTGEMSYGFASNRRDALSNASFIGFTDTPIEKTDENTRAGGENVELAELRTPRLDTSPRPSPRSRRRGRITFANGLNPALHTDSTSHPARYMNLRLVVRGVLTPPSAIRTSPDLGGTLGTARPTSAGSWSQCAGFDPFRRSVSSLFPVE